MRVTTRFLLASLTLFGMVSITRAQAPFSPATAVFTFAAAPGPDEVDDVNGDPLPDAADTLKRPYGRVGEVRIARPETYIAKQAGTVTVSGELTTFAFTVSPYSADKKTPAFVGTAAVGLGFPAQTALQ